MKLQLKQKLLNTQLFQNCEALDKYVDLILLNLNQIYDSNTMQCHHVLPRSYFSIVHKELDNSSNNKINLLFKDHVLAHYYLALCTTGPLRIAMENAFLMLTNFSSIEEKELIKNLESYQKIYENVAQARKGIEPSNKGKAMSEEQKKKISQAATGRKYSAEAREKMRQGQLKMSPENRAKITAATRARNYKATEETRQKISNSLMGHQVSQETRLKISAGGVKRKGQRWYNNGHISICLSAGEPIPDGFVLGTLRKAHWVTNGLENHRIYGDQPIPEGFYIGRTLNKKREEEKNGKA